MRKRESSEFRVQSSEFREERFQPPAGVASSAGQIMRGTQVSDFGTGGVFRFSAFGGFGFQGRTEFREERLLAARLFGCFLKPESAEGGKPETLCQDAPYALKVSQNAVFLRRGGRVMSSGLRVGRVGLVRLLPCSSDDH